MDRRTFLIGSASGLGALSLASCARLSTHPPTNDRQSRYSPIKSSDERVLRSVVGLRPFRPAGYRLAIETLDGKTIVHNYGHGGAGITLSWGTSKTAAELAVSSNPKSVAVLGSGVMGLTTSLLLAEKGLAVALYAADFPPHTTSNVAAAVWLPSSYFDRDVVTPDFLTSDRANIRSSFRRFLAFVNRPRYGVYWNTYHLLRQSAPKTQREQPGGDDLYPELTYSVNNNLFGFAHQKKMRVLMIDPMLYLPSLMQDAQIAGVRTRQERFESTDQVLSLNADVIVNCTGMGAKTLFDDTSMYPVQGQLTHLLPQPEINYSYVVPTEDGYLYMFPRRGSIVLGGTSIKGAYSTEPDMALARRMIAGHRELADRLRT
ncbi:MAG: FAD-dependent oxidoreductase [Pseudomonadota bacterium]